MSTPSRLLRDISSVQLATIERPILAIPVGSCEQHGPHLPLGTDSIVAEALCAYLSAANSRVVVGPTLSVTSSGEHAGFAGTLSIGAPVTASMIVELVRSAEWADSVVLVNGHGGNANAITTAVATLRAESRRVTDWWPHIDGGDAHAGHVETSLMLHLAAHLVDMGRAEAGDLRPLPEIADELIRSGMRSVTSIGVLGDPRGASREDGERLFAQLVDQLIDHVARHH
ncbi:MAG: mycofactocin biosynthesis peptidyl-dipeptidase MftE [Ilumatobacteraceae bacterium]